MTIRTATAADANAIRTVAEASWESDYPDILSSESIEAGLEEWYSESSIEAAIERTDSRTFVAEADGDVVGFVHAIWDVEKDEGDVLRLYVHPDHRGQGIGTDLLEIACHELIDSGAERVKAMVLAANDVGNEFYADFGFERVDTEEVHIGGDAYSEHTYELRPEAVTG